MADLTAVTAVSRRAKADGLLDYGRVPGTIYDGLTASWLERRFREAGLSQVRQDPYDLPDPEWMLDGVSLDIDTGRGTVSMPSAFTPDQSPVTPPEGTTAEIIDIGDGSAAARARRDLSGKIVLVHSRVEGIAYDHPARALVPDLEREGIAGLILAIRQPGDPQTRYAVQPGPIRFRVTRTPWITISGADALTLSTLIDQAPGKACLKATIRVEGRLTPPGRSQNIMGVVPGRSDEVTLVTAHTDSRWEGATDNASGVSLLLGLARHFASRPLPERTLVFVATGGHHNGPSSGQKHIIAAHPDLIGRCALIVNLEHVGSREPDGRGGLQERAGPNVMFVPNQNPDLLRLVEAGVAAHGVPVLRPVQTFWTADYYVHARLGTPAVMILQPSFWYHTEADTMDKVHPEDLSAMARLHADLISGADAVSRADLRIGVPSLSFGT
ncbi:hypothetical protein GGR13_002212 [Brevundimonas variabilis]|uniref:Peptidase M28 domain-containing protein n=2 Tax=Brevundimonas variabilis TaxID=74312 RepID=A0A7W9FGF6_9CAUL|nr:hypothetical protein [Brevundimonas variabilis]